uniref:Si:dkey-42p14.6 n=1 Tax=Sinocyclocheilus rhinocerous TaxID=307959 RepID=A0A673IXT5_9TELE
MSSPRELEAAEYLEKHKIIELMDNLTSMLFFYRPGGTFDSILDPSHQGFITYSQYKEGKTTIMLQRL